MIRYQCFKHESSNTLKGFTILEVTVAMGLGSLIMYFMSTAFINMNKAQRNTTLASDFQSLVSELQLSMSDPLNCTVTFADPSFAYRVDPQQQTPANLPISNGQGIYVARKGTGSVKIERARAILPIHQPDVNQVISTYGSGLQITQVQIQDWSGVAPVYFANLYVQAQKYPAGAAVTALGARLIEKKIPFQIVTDPTGKITACGGTQASLPIPVSDTSDSPSGQTTNPQGPSSDSSLLTKQLSPEEEKQVQDFIKKTINSLGRSD